MILFFCNMLLISFSELKIYFALNPVYCRLSLCCQSNNKEIPQPCTGTVQGVHCWSNPNVLFLFCEGFFERFIAFTESSPSVANKSDQIQATLQHLTEATQELRRSQKASEERERDRARRAFAARRLVLCMNLILHLLSKNSTTLLKVGSGFEISPCKIFYLCNNTLLLPISNHE